MSKYIFVTGGVLSGWARVSPPRPWACCSKATALKSRFRSSILTSTSIPGTMNPFQHGEVYVTDDGAETDLDLGHYERFTRRERPDTHNWTAGRIYDIIIRKERGASIWGKPSRSFRTSPTRSRMRSRAVRSENDIIIVEIGGTVGDIESLPFLEAIRQMRLTSGPKTRCSSI